MITTNITTNKCTINEYVVWEHNISIYQYIFSKKHTDNDRGRKKNNASRDNSKEKRDHKHKKLKKTNYTVINGENI